MVNNSALLNQEIFRTFFRTLHLVIRVLLHPASSFFGTQQQLTHPPVKTSTLFLRKNHVSYNLLLCNVLILPGLGFIWIDTHPYYSLSVYVLLYYLRSTSIAMERCYPKYFILCLVNFYSKRSALSNIFYLWLTYFHSEKDHLLSEQCSTRLSQIRFKFVS